MTSPCMINENGVHDIIIPITDEDGIIRSAVCQYCGRTMRVEMPDENTLIQKENIVHEFELSSQDRNLMFSVGTTEMSKEEFQNLLDKGVTITKWKEIKCL